MGEWVVYRKQKSSPAPGPRAKQIVPAAKGEAYHYLVDKYWVIRSIRDDGRLELQTRQGKVHVVEPDDFRLRRARWWERWLLADRFPSVSEEPQES